MSALQAVFAEFHFLRPWWLLALLLLPLLTLLWRRLQASRDPWRQAVDGHLLEALRAPDTQQGERGPLALALLIALLAVVALAGPAWQRLPQPLLRAESALIVALDLSDRMRATDLAPSRLQRARFKVADLLRERRDGQVALIAYAGDAFTVAPLTDDANTLLSLLASLDHETLPEQGQRADRAIGEARRLLRHAGFAEGDLLLITDRAGEADIRAAEAAGADGLRVSVLGVGSEAGAPIALPGGGFLRDERGEIQLPRRDDRSLGSLAEAGLGRYATLAIDQSDLSSLGLLDPVGQAAMQEDEAKSERFRDEGIWLLLALLPLAALLFRRGWLACLPLACLCLPPPAAAFDLSSLWQRDDQRAWQALQEDSIEVARALAQDPQLRGAAAYRDGDYAAAAAEFQRGDSADAHYNRGNALARAGQLAEALQAYDEALARAPEMDDAKANRAAVEAALQKQQQEQQQQQQQQEGDESESGDPGEGSPEPQEPGDESESGSESESEQSSDEDRNAAQPSGSQEDAAEDDAASAETPSPADADAQQAEHYAEEMARALAEQGESADEGEPRQALTPEQTEANEQQQAIEQLLRRVPDDPGGLLRRKFAIEARRRQLEGRENEP